MVRSDAEVLVKLKENRDSIDDRLSEMLSKPRPTYDVDGQKMDFTQYQKMLTEMRESIQEQIDAMATVADASDAGGFTETQLFGGA